MTWLVRAVCLLVLGAHVWAAQPASRPQHVTVTSRVSDSRVALGQRFSVLLDLVPSPGIHVYAPDVTRYRPIRLNVRPQAGLIARDVKYPSSEDYYYAPLKEHVPVYQKPFQIVQELAFDQSPPGRVGLKGVSVVTIEGSLSYQACDDRICYPPKTLPLTWTLHVKAATQ